MAGTVQTQCLFIDPKFMQDQFQADGRSLVDMDRAIEKLASMIDKDPFEMRKMLGDRYDSRYIEVADHLDERTVQRSSDEAARRRAHAHARAVLSDGRDRRAHLGGVGGEGVGLEGWR
jgi:hypothetical protein